jgi:hypothetical protein
MVMFYYVLIGFLIVVVLIYLIRGERSLARKGSPFRLYLVFINLASLPDLANSVLEGSHGQSRAPGFLAYVPPRVLYRRGLKSDQIVGFLIDSAIGFVPGNFTANKAFKNKIHMIATTAIPASIQEQATSFQAGEIPLIDDRVSSMHTEVDDEHCIGRYKVESGRVVDYAPNPNFQLLSIHGPLELVDEIRNALFSEFSKANGNQPIIN